MELKTKVTAAPAALDLRITRDFDLPVHLLYRAYTEQELVERWMSHEHGTMRYLKFDCQDQGSYLFQTTDSQGKVAFQARGNFHSLVPNAKMVRTFEIMHSPAGVQLEILDFEALDEGKSRLRIHSIYESAQGRDMILQHGFAKGLSMAHDRLENLITPLQ